MNRKGQPNDGKNYNRPDGLEVVRRRATEDEKRAIAQQAMADRTPERAKRITESRVLAVKENPAVKGKVMYAHVQATWESGASAQGIAAQATVVYSLAPNISRWMTLESYDHWSEANKQAKATGGKPVAPDMQQQHTLAGEELWQLASYFRDEAINQRLALPEDIPEAMQAGLPAFFESLLPDKAQNT